MASQHLFYPIDPDWKTDPRPRFEDHYKQIVNLQYPARGDAPRREVFGERKNRSCAVCGRKPPEVTFRKASHVLPAALGNRTYFSNEECDFCNTKYGDWSENDLAVWLAPELAIGRVRTRDRSARRLKTDMGSSIGMNPATEVLEVKLNGSDPSLSMTEISPDAIQISFTRGAYRPINALRSLLRSAWLAMSEESRDKFPNLIKMANGEVELCPTEYFHSFVPGGGYQQVQFDAWEKSTESLEGAELVLRLLVSHVALIWSLPKSPGIPGRPSLLPPIPMRDPAKFGTPSGQLVSVVSPESRPASRDSVIIRFSEKIAGSQIQTRPQKSKKRPRPQLQVQLRVIASGQEKAAIVTTMHMQRYDDQAVRVLFSGDEFLGALVIHVDYRNSSSRVNLEVRLQGSNARNARKTLRFLDSLRQGEMQVHRQDQPETLLMRFGTASSGLDLENDRRIVEWIETINSELGCDLIFPDPEDHIQLEELEVLAEGIRHGTVRIRGEAKVEVFGAWMGDQRLLEALRENKTAIGMTCKMETPYRIDDVLLDVGHWAITMEQVRLETPPDGDQLREKESGSKPSATAISESRIFTFNRWLPASVTGKNEEPIKTDSTHREPEGT